MSELYMLPDGAGNFSINNARLLIVPLGCNRMLQAV